MLWLANLTGEKRKVRVNGMAGAARLHMLSEANFEAIAKDANFLSTSVKALNRVTSVELGPYAVARIAAV